MSKKIRNAIIESTMLGYEDHGIMTCMLYTMSAGVGQGFGGYAFDQWSEEDKKRYGRGYGIEFIARILKTVGVNEWEHLKGKHIRVDADHTKIYGIGNIIEDKWFYPAEDLREFAGEHEE